MSDRDDKRTDFGEVALVALSRVEELKFDHMAIVARKEQGERYTPANETSTFSIISRYVLVDAGQRHDAHSGKAGLRVPRIALTVTPAVLRAELTNVICIILIVIEVVVSLSIRVVVGVEIIALLLVGVVVFLVLLLLLISVLISTVLFGSN